MRPLFICHVGSGAASTCGGEGEARQRSVHREIGGRGGLAFPREGMGSLSAPGLVGARPDRVGEARYKTGPVRRLSNMHAACVASRQEGQVRSFPPLSPPLVAHSATGTFPGPSRIEFDASAGTLQCGQPRPPRRKSPPAWTRCGECLPRVPECQTLDGVRLASPPGPADLAEGVDEASCQTRGVPVKGGGKSARVSGPAACDDGCAVVGWKPPAGLLAHAHSWREIHLQDSAGSTKGIHVNTR